MLRGVSETLATDIMEALENVEVPKQIDNSLKAPVFIQEEVDNSIPSRIREDLALYSFGYEGIKFITEIRMVFEKLKSRRN